ncbi:MAG: septum formation initiator family protein [Campylobacterota bacterium]|nr:septum formation initiator family protein [Campylobacterota bacterium]
MKFINLIKSNFKFLLLSFSLVIFIIISAIYIANLLFAGKNSYGVYSSLKNKKIQLQNEIKQLQFENADLQKKYLELKNLEPEEL